MTPLGRLIEDQMRDRGWTPGDVETRGIAHSTLQHLRTRSEWRQPPRPATLQKLANALDLPLSRVEQAADASIPRRYKVVEHEEDDMSLVIATMKDSPEARAALAALARELQADMAMGETKAQS